MLAMVGHDHKKIALVVPEATIKGVLRSLAVFFVVSVVTYVNL